MDTIILGSLLLFSVGFIIFRLAKQTKALILNQSPACHGDGDDSCSHCQPKNP